MESNWDESCEISQHYWVNGSCKIFHDPTWNLTGMNLVRSRNIVGCMDHARSFMVLHEDSHNRICKIFREDLVCGLC